MAPLCEDRVMSEFMSLVRERTPILTDGRIETR